MCSGANVADQSVDLVCLDPDTAQGLVIMARFWVLDPEG
jgi:hypothetical protein